MKWIKYQIVCNEDENVLLNKKLEYTEANLVIAQEEAYDGYTVVEDDVVFETKDSCDIFVVHMSYSSSTGDYSADKTFDEIVENHNAGKLCYAIDGTLIYNLTLVSSTLLRFTCFANDCSFIFELSDSNDLTGSTYQFLDADEKGVAGGVATLDNSGKVPSGQLPAMNYIPTNQKGAANGVASLDADGHVPSGQVCNVKVISSSHISGQLPVDSTKAYSRYCKIGRLVYVYLWLELSDHTSAGGATVHISNLPGIYGNVSTYVPAIGYRTRVDANNEAFLCAAYIASNYTASTSSVTGIPFESDTKKVYINFTYIAEN